MIEYYTAIGQYQLRRGEGGAQYPVLVQHGREYIPTIPEMLLWTKLMWHLRTGEELRSSYYDALAELHFMEELPFETVLQKLLDKGLVRCGTGYTAADALYELIAPLALVPATSSLGVQWMAFFHLLFARKVGLRMALRVFHRPKLDPDEKSAFALIRKAEMNCAELIACHDLGLRHLRNDEMLVDALYTHPDLTCDNLPAYTRASAHKYTVLQAVAGLYHKRQILFEVYG